MGKPARPSLESMKLYWSAPVCHTFRDGHSNGRCSPSKYFARHKSYSASLITDVLMLPWRSGKDETCMAFRDINAQAPTHFLVIPKVRDGLTRLSNATEKHKAVLGHCMWAAAQKLWKLELKTWKRLFSVCENLRQKCWITM